MSEQTTSSFAHAQRGIWRYLPWVLVVLALLLLFQGTLQSMVTIWWRSETYTHAFLVAPISGWLIWRRRAAWWAEPVAPMLWMLVPMAAACLLWLMGELASVNPASQMALVALVVLSVPATLGWRVARQNIFPLLFLFFCVPIGEFLTDPMIAATADFTVWALRATGIPVYREGMQFVIPSGNWSVVEACSGVRYLIASFMVGTLFAYLNYNTWRRRLAFVVVSLLTPVVANWLRAYMIVMLGHLSGNKLAVGADHLVYGWVFFGLVIMLMFWIGGRFAEPEVPLPTVADAAEGGIGRPASWAAAVAVVALAATAVMAQWRLMNGPAETMPVRLQLPEHLPGGWVASGSALSSWQPRFRNPAAQIERTYEQAGARVTVWVAFYRHQHEGSKLVSSVNRLVDAESSEWLHIPQSSRPVMLDGVLQAMRGAQLRTPSDPKVTATQRLNVLYAYRIGGEWMISDARAKVRLALQRLLGQGDDGSVVFFYAPVEDEGNAQRMRLEEFASRHAAAILAALDAATGRR